jgi:copper chaperone CopZ
MKAKLNIKGMHCSSCEMLLTDVLQDLPGMKQVKVSLKTHSAEIEYDPKQLTDAQITKSIEAEGYTVEK